MALTTNFDQLLLAACATCGVAPTVYDCATASSSEDFSARPLVVYLNGQRHMQTALGSGDEVARHRRRVEPVIKRILGQGMPVVAVGMSGEDDIVTPILAAHDRFRHRLFWLAHRDSPKLPAVLLRPRDALYIGGHDAESFFTSLAVALKTLPPGFVADPVSDLANRLETIRRPLSGGLSEQVDFWISWLRANAVKLPANAGPPVMPELRWPPTAPPVTEGAPPTENGDKDLQPIPAGDEKTASEPKLKLVVGDYESLVDDHAAGLLDSDEGKAAAAAALAIEPDMHEALLNWASALHVQAQSSGGEEAARFWAEAVAKYESALEQRSDDPETLTDCANALIAFARSRPEAEEVLARALNKLEAAYALGDNSAYVGLLELTLCHGEKDQLARMLDRKPAKLPLRCHFVLALISLVTRIEADEPFDLDPFDDLPELREAPCQGWEFQDYDSVIGRLDPENGDLIQAIIDLLQGRRPLTEWARWRDNWLIDRAHRQTQPEKFVAPGLVHRPKRRRQPKFGKLMHRQRPGARGRERSECAGSLVGLGPAGPGSRRSGQGSILARR